MNVPSTHCISYDFAIDIREVVPPEPDGDRLHGVVHFSGEYITVGFGRSPDRHLDKSHFEYRKQEEDGEELTCCSHRTQAP